jgi:hypothetical protein
MVVFREGVDKQMERGALMDTLNQIRDRSQSQFSNPLIVGYYEPEPEMRLAGHVPHFYVAEECTMYWLHIIPCRQYHILFAVNRGFYGAAYGKKEVSCMVRSRSLLEIVKDELRKYAESAGVTKVNLTQDFSY